MAQKGGLLISTDAQSDNSAGVDSSDTSKHQDPIKPCGEKWWLDREKQRTAYCGKWRRSRGPLYLRHNVVRAMFDPSKMLQDTWTFADHVSRFNSVAR